SRAVDADVVRAVVPRLPGRRAAQPEGDVMRVTPPDPATPPGRPAAKPRPLRIAMVAPGRGATGGQETQASTLEDRLRAEGHGVRRIPIDPVLPPSVQWARGVPYVRTLFNEAFYVRSLMTVRLADVVHVFSASYWSFLLSPLPALLTGRMFRRRVVLHYHSGEAEEHLRRWGMLVHPWLRLADALVVPSLYLREVFAAHGYATRLIPNVIETERFR